MRAYPKRRYVATSSDNYLCNGIQGRSYTNRFLIRLFTISSFAMHFGSWHWTGLRGIAERLALGLNV